jgi:RNA polymerase sigma factor (TIGR02999 family)
MADTAARVTKLLHAIDRGERGAAEELLPLIYEELRSRAGKLMAGERRDHTLQRTALVHEAYLKFAGGSGNPLNFQSRVHFFNAAALAMRRILVDHATRRATVKRGGGRQRVEIDDVDLTDQSAQIIDWVELDAALDQLEQASPRRHQVVMLRFFSGRTESEIAEMLDVSEVTVRRDWTTARTWLYRNMRRPE